MTEADFRVLELFSGVGGMHLALERLGINYKVVAAVEINDMANNVYRHNFPGSNSMQKNIEGLTLKQITKLNPNMILMSPPCQPFTRQGLKQDMGDSRCMPLLHILEILPELSIINYLLLENVVGFESSQARDQVVEVLKSSNFEIQEFHLCPTQFSIPNRRPRYYLLAKRKPLPFKFEVLKSLQLNYPATLTDTANLLLNKVQNEVIKKTDSPDQCFKISQVLEATAHESCNVKEKDLRFFMEFDLVSADSKTSACFTKSYKRYFLGTGSVLIENHDMLSQYKDSQRDHLKWVQEVLKPRFFTTREILRLMCFPEWFTFPSGVTEKQASALLGNSINIHVVALLIGLLIDE